MTDYKEKLDANLHAGFLVGQHTLQIFTELIDITAFVAATLLVCRQHLGWR